MKKWTKIIGTMMSIVLAVTAFSGCTNSDDKKIEQAKAHVNKIISTLESDDVGYVSYENISHGNGVNEVTSGYATFTAEEYSEDFQYLRKEELVTVNYADMISIYHNLTTFDYVTDCDVTDNSLSCENTYELENGIGYRKIEAEFDENKGLTNLDVENKYIYSTENYTPTDEDLTKLIKDNAEQSSEEKENAVHLQYVTMKFIDEDSIDRELILNNAIDKLYMSENATYEGRYEYAVYSSDDWHRDGEVEGTINNGNYEFVRSMEGHLLNGGTEGQRVSFTDEGTLDKIIDNDTKALEIINAVSLDDCSIAYDGNYILKCNVAYNGKGINSSGEQEVRYGAKGTISISFVDQANVQSIKYDVGMINDVIVSTSDDIIGDFDALLTKEFNVYPPGIFEVENHMFYAYRKEETIVKFEE